MYEDELQRILDRAGIKTPPTDLHALGFRNRAGSVLLPLEAMLTVARAFAAAEPQIVTDFLDDQEAELRAKGNVPGDRWYHDYLREKGPAHALARRWAGLEQEAEALRQEIARLRGLLSSAAYDLRAAGQERKGARLLRALEAGKRPRQRPRLGTGSAGLAVVSGPRLGSGCQPGVRSRLEKAHDAASTVSRVRRAKLAGGALAVRRAHRLVPVGVSGYVGHPVAEPSASGDRPISNDARLHCP